MCTAPAQEQLSDECWLLAGRQDTQILSSSALQSAAWTQLGTNTFIKMYSFALRILVRPPNTSHPGMLAAPEPRAHFYTKYACSGWWLGSQPRNFDFSFLLISAVTEIWYSGSLRFSMTSVSILHFRVGGSKIDNLPTSKIQNTKVCMIQKCYLL